MVLIYFKFLVLLEVEYNVAKVIELMTTSIVGFSYVSYRNRFSDFLLMRLVEEKRH